MTENYRLHGRAAIRTRSRGPQRNGPVTVTRIDPLVYAVALEFAAGDPNRISIVSASTVLVQNRPRRRT